MKLPNVFNPNKELAATSILWYLIAVGLMVIAITLVFSENWQTSGFVHAVYHGSTIVRAKEISPANDFSVKPSVISTVWAVFIYGALLVRRYIRSFTNLPTLVLVFCNVFFIASLIEAFLPSESITLLSFLWVDLIKVNPQQLLLGALMLTWLGMRALSGAVILVLGVAFLSRVHDLNVSLGLYGTFYALCGFMSVFIQMKLPYMVHEGGWMNSFLHDFGRIQIVAVDNVNALGDTVTNTASSVVASTKRMIP